MKEFIISSKNALFVFLLAFLAIIFNPYEDKSDMEIMAVVQKNRANLHNKNNPSKHTMIPIDESQKFRGVFYGYLPCDDCAGIKMTLSLKDKQNYLLVKQYARSSNKEYYDKGKYEWDEKTNTVILTSRKDKKIQQYHIKNEGELILLKSDGTKIRGNQDKYTLLRTDKNKSRQIHIH